MKTNMKSSNNDHVVEDIAPGSSTFKLMFSWSGVIPSTKELAGRLGLSGTRKAFLQSFKHNRSPLFYCWHQSDLCWENWEIDRATRLYIPNPAVHVKEGVQYIHKVRIYTGHHNVPSLAGECAPLPRTGGVTLACGLGVGGVPNPTTFRKSLALCLLCVAAM